MRNIFKLTVWGILILLVVCQLSAQTSLEVVDDEIDAMTVLQVADKVTISYIDVDSKGNPVQRSNIFTIRPDGTIFHELLGAVALANMTIAEAEEVLTEKFSQFFNQPRVALSVLEKTSIKVILYGEVSRVGVFPIKPNTRVAEFIIENGGTTPEADLARITVSRADGGKVIFDMEKYLFTSEPVNNVILKDKDKIIVPRFKVQEKYGRLSKNYVLQYGNVLEIIINEMALMETNPAQSESYVLDSEGNIFHRLFGLVHLGGITVDKSQEVLAEMAKRYFRDPIVSVDVLELSSRNVFVFGSVLRPGIYPIEGNVQLAELLVTIGGLSDDADLREIVVTRKQGRPVVFNLEDFLFKRDDSKNVFLEDGDRVIVQKRQRGFFVRLAEKIQPFSIIFSFITTGLTIYLVLSR
ncbi:polysaccharide biosynthesis/export family protein [bacterium]|nr:polysaccharide biosynthesis/export family protein [bacterium]MBU1065724.1 polysaccharide biosynthesis/export family protein [bacterium]MBU1633513.1 polysaccharide biosynthesis/export family protein [bacterium]MBU1874975.1 polysaccharide biosynthesis/export family protein [bacterium]